MQIMLQFITIFKQPAVVPEDDREEQQPLWQDVVPPHSQIFPSRDLNPSVGVGLVSLSVCGSKRCFNNCSSYCSTWISTQDSARLFAHHWLRHYLSHKICMHFCLSIDCVAIQWWSFMHLLSPHKSGITSLKYSLWTIKRRKYQCLPGASTV